MTGQNEVLVELLDDFMEQHCLVVARSLAQASSELTLIQVLNPSPVSVALYENEKVAVASRSTTFFVIPHKRQNIIAL